jgi:hypothetical protein
MDYPKLPTEIRFINKQLQDHFGVDTDTTQPMWRVAWSNDQFEMRRDNVTAAGIHLIHPEVMNLPKYSWIKSKWILERLVLVPETHQADLPGITKSYECMYAFEHKETGATIIPSFEACKFVVDLVYSAIGKSNMAKYVDPDTAEDAREKRIAKLTEELFGDESGLLGRTITGEAVGYTGEPKITSQLVKE